MLLIRLYIAALTVTFLGAISFTRGLGILEGIVIACPLLFMIFDLQVELRELRELETRVSNFVDRF